MLFLAGIAIFLLSTCKKMPDNAPDNQPVPGEPTKPPDLTSIVTTTVSGFVNYTSNEGDMDGVTITIGSRSTGIDKYGYFELRDVAVPKEAALITVSRPGLHTVIKTFVAGEAKSAYLFINLSAPDNQMSFSTTFGVNLLTSGDFGIAIPANSMVNAVTKQPYSGEVLMRLQRSLRGIDYGSDVGDDRGIDSTGKVKWLDSYGVVSVECEGSGGEALELADGKKATIRFGFPYTSAAEAPAIAPMWYFDKEIALWRQLGEATKTADGYETEINKFSNWKVAVPTGLVRFSCTLTDSLNNPLPYTVLRLEDSRNPSNSGVVFFTNADGHAEGFIPDQRYFIARLFGNPGYEPPTVFRPFNGLGSDVSMGKVAIPGAYVATVSGKLVNCKGEPVTDGYVMKWRRGRIPVNGAGEFKFGVPVTGDPVDNFTIFYPEDKATGQSGNLIRETLTPGVHAYGAISTCGTERLEDFSAMLEDGGGKPLFAVWAKLSNLSNAQEEPTWIMPTTKGAIKSRLHHNSRYLFEVFSSPNCDVPAFSKEIVTVISPVALGEVEVTGLQAAQVSGTVTDCNGKNISKGFVVVRKGLRTFSFPVNAEGKFQFAFPVCNGATTEPVSFIALNGRDNAINTVLNTNFTRGDNSLGDVKACATPPSAEEYLFYILDGVTHPFVSPRDVLSESKLPPAVANFNWVRAYSDSLRDGLAFILTGNLDKTAAGDDLFVDEFDVPGYLRKGGEVRVYITECGSVGQYLAGHFIINVYKSVDDAEPPHPLICLFQVKRTQ